MRVLRFDRSMIGRVIIKACILSVLPISFSFMAAGTESAVEQKRQEKRTQSFQGDQVFIKNKPGVTETVESKHYMERKREKADIARIEAELLELKESFDQMTVNSGSKTLKEKDGLDIIASMVRRKKDLEQHLQELRRAHKEAERTRQEEIRRYKAEQKAIFVSALKKDIEKYNEIILSTEDQGIKEIAWIALANKYSEVSNSLKEGDTEELLFRVAYKGVTNSIGMRFVMIPAGTFTMGSPISERGREADELRHEVTITKAFYLQTTEVTQAQWHEIMGNNPCHFSGLSNDCPVECVTWNECVEFIRRLNEREGTNKYRLPTESEWEYACRAGKTTAFTNGRIKVMECGLDPNLDRVGWYCGNSERRTHPVAQRESNAWGVYDMHGNVWEWCEDFYSRYPSDAVADPHNCRSGSRRVLRGGGWSNYVENCRCAFRYCYEPNRNLNNLGFRVARTR